MMSASGHDERKEREGVPSAPHSTQTGDWLNLLLDERELLAWEGFGEFGDVATAWYCRRSPSEAFRDPPP
jgi:hypothetical protein